MKNWKPLLLLVAVVAVLAVIATRTFWPKTVTQPSIPTIVTKYDTISSLPKWYQDSVAYWKKRKFTTDTIEIVISETIVDTQLIPVNSPPEDRPDVWPLLAYNGSAKFGDTAIVSTYSIRSGNASIQKIFIPGVLIGIDAYREGESQPRLNYAPFPPQEKHGFWHNPKIFGLGFGSCIAIAAGASLIK